MNWGAFDSIVITRLFLASPIHLRNLSRVPPYSFIILISPRHVNDQRSVKRSPRYPLLFANAYSLPEDRD
jgi:hypothetical protein